MDFKVIGHPKATIIQDDIFSYLVIEYDHAEHVDVFRNVIGGVYEIHRCFFNHEHFEASMPNVAATVKQHWKEFFTV